MHRFRLCSRRTPQLTPRSEILQQFFARHLRRFAPSIPIDFSAAPSALATSRTTSPITTVPAVNGDARHASNSLIVNTRPPTLHPGTAEALPATSASVCRVRWHIDHRTRNSCSMVLFLPRRATLRRPSDAPHSAMPPALHPSRPLHPMKPGSCLCQNKAHNLTRPTPPHPRSRRLQPRREQQLAWSTLAAPWLSYIPA